MGDSSPQPGEEGIILCGPAEAVRWAAADHSCESVTCILLCMVFFVGLGVEVGIFV